MNSFNATHDDLNMLLDGELSTARATEVYKLLMEQSAVRAQFHRLLLLRSTVQQDLEQLDPSDSAREAIFGALGFSTAPAAGPAAIEGSRTVAWWSRLPGYLMAAVIGAIGMYLFMMNESRDTQPVQGSSVVQSTAATRPVTPGSPPAAMPAAQTPDRVTAEIVPARQHVQHRSRSARTVPVDSVSVVDSSGSTNNQGTVKDGKDVVRTSVMVSDHSVAQEPATVAPIVVHNNPITVQQIVAPDAKPSPVALQLRGMASGSFPGATIAPQSNPWFRDMAVGASYVLDAHHSIGIEAGQEAIMQRYSGIEHDSTVRYEQNPMTAWGGLQYQFSTGPITALEDIRAYGTLLAGATKFGPLGRAGAGLQYNLDKRVRLLAGIEGTALMFDFQDQWFMSRKLGFTYGIVWQL
jgi:anti-sigma factor RsiW